MVVCHHPHCQAATGGIAAASTPWAVRRCRHLGASVSGALVWPLAVLVCGAVAGAGGNVASLESRLAHTPHSGTPIFVRGALLQVPASVALASLRERVAEACDQEDLDVALEASS